MKFDNIKNPNGQSKASHKALKRFKSSEESIKTIKRYNNVSVYFMKPGTKGNFKHIATLANDGSYPSSWSIRVYITHGQWTIQIAPHPDIPSSSLNIDVNDIVENLFEEDEWVESYGTLHLGTMKTTDESKAEEIINKLIEKFKDSKLDGVEDLPIYSKYSLGESTKEYKIPYNIHSLQDEKSLSKYKILYNELIQAALSPEEKKKLKDIDFNNISEDDKNTLIELSKQHLSESQRIKIAMKYMV